ncbi:MAG TPA: hypothetical protein ENI85_03030 [Deltaproteobacteria bacterium]|nr:hypothetical protein [Deltaproteobacteria bacterium]
MPLPIPEKHSTLFTISFAMILLGITAGCVSTELNEMNDAEQAYEECGTRLSPSHPDCEALWRTYLDAQRRYEESARRAWNCRPQLEECPTPR